MKEQTGENYQSSAFAKALMVSEAKVGKSAFMIASALGVLPWQTEGGIVTNPEDLTVITADAGALSGIKSFMLKTCKAPPEALKFNVYNLQDDVRHISSNSDDWDFSLHNSMLECIQRFAQKRKGKGTPVLMFSSLTGFAQAFERGLAGPPSKERKGSGMDQSKWQALSAQLNELRNTAQQDDWHCLWEAHVYKPPATGQNKDDESRPETLSISGKSGQLFAYNVEQVFRIRRLYSDAHPGTECDKVYLDTKPDFDFISGGRNFTEALKAREPDMTVAFRKLGLKVGGWGAKSAAPKVVAKKPVVAAVK